MEQLTRVLEKPERYFTKDFTIYSQIFNYAVYEESPFFWEDDCLIVYVRSGSGRAVVNQAVYNIQAGSLGLLQSYHVFRFENSGDAPLELQILAYPYPELVMMDFLPPKTSPENRVNLYGAVFVSPSADQCRTIESLLCTLQQELDAPDHITPMIRNCLLVQIRQFYRTLHMKCPAPKMPLCGELFVYIAVNSFSNLSQTTVAKEFSLNASQINQELRRVCKENYQGVLNHSRLSNTYSMMLRGNMSLSQISKQAGFLSESSFYRIFQETYQTTPQKRREDIVRHLRGTIKTLDDRLLEIGSYVFHHFRTPINCETCARELFLTSEAINQILQEKYGINFNQFLVATRLRYAVGLLTMSDTPVCDIAMDVGFHSIHTFIRLFKKYYGMSPTAYRRQEGVM